MRCLTILLAVATATSAAAAPIESVYTTIGGSGCRDTDLDEVSYERRCRGPGGAPVVIVVGDDRHTVSFGRTADKELAAREGFLGLNGIGDTIEWRGERVGQALRPFATILRWRLMSDDKPHAILVVTRLGPGGACHAAYVDAAANPDANALARRAADEGAQSFRCGKDKPAIVGKPGRGSDLARTTRNVLDR